MKTLFFAILIVGIAAIAGVIVIAYMSLRADVSDETQEQNTHSDDR